MRSIAIVAALAALTAACGEDAAAPSAPVAPPAQVNTPTPAPLPSRVVAALDPEGVRVVNGETGSTRLLAFGAPAAQMRDAVALTRSGQAGATGTNSECGAGALDYAQWPELTLWFQNDAFVGWSANQPGASTLTGIGVGATRVQLERDYRIQTEETSLGTQFSAGDLHGVIDDGGVVSALWAGTSCNFG